MHITLPPAFLTRMSDLLGDEYPAFLASYDAPPVMGLRVNTLKISVEDFRATAPFTLAPLPWCPAGFTVPDEQAAGKHPWHAAGLYYLQEPSAMAVAELLDPQPGERVLDLAAAPGGKATHIAALMGGQGLLIANELHPKRAWALAENLERWGAGHVAITNEPPERLAARFAGFFDRVLLDAPCSGEGMFRKSESARQEWSPALVHGCAQRQTLILEHAARLVRPGGRLVYSTCTFAPEEDEAVIADFLAAHADFDLLAPPRRPGFSPGLDNPSFWLGGFSRSLPLTTQPAEASSPDHGSYCTFAPEEDEAVIADFLAAHADFDLLAPPRRPGFSPGLDNPSFWFGGFSRSLPLTTQPAEASSPDHGSYGHCADSEPRQGRSPNLSLTVRLWPHTGPGEGHFIAVLQRNAAAADLALAPKPWKITPLSRPVEQAYHAFCAANLATPPTMDRLALVGAYLYALPADLPDPSSASGRGLTSLRFLHPGWWLGIVKKDRFEPSHALALRLPQRAARRYVDLPLDSADLRGYLRGESFRSPGEDGWLLVAAAGFPIGWGKRINGVIKNHYPKGLRWV